MSITLRRLAAIVAAASFLGPVWCHAGPATEQLSTLRQLLELPEASVDLARVKVDIDRMIDPSIDAAATLKRLEEMASAVKERLPATANSHQKIEALRAYLYEPGPRNEGKHFSYDLDDPYGRDVRNKLLSTYLATRKGNCVSMPLLFLLVGQKLELDLSAVTAPAHVFVKFRDEAGKAINVEATSGGYKLDDSYRRDIPMTDQAIKNGVYMRALSKRETVALMAGTLMEFLNRERKPEQRIAVAHLILEFYPNDVTAMLHKGHAYSQMIERDFMSRYDSPTAIPPAERPQFVRLRKANELWYSRAEALGWRQPSQEQESNYTDAVNRARGEKK